MQVRENFQNKMNWKSFWHRKKELLFLSALRKFLILQWLYTGKKELRKTAGQRFL